MLIKIENLTVRDIKNVCKNKRYCNKNCAFYKHQWLCLGLKNMTEKELNSEVEIKK